MADGTALTSTLCLPALHDHGDPDGRTRASFHALDRFGLGRRGVRPSGVVRPTAGGPPSPLEAAVLEHAVRMASAQPIFRDPGGGSPVALMPLFSFVVSG